MERAQKEESIGVLKADLAKALFSLPAVLGVEYGIGFGCATLRGSQNNDAFFAQDTQGRAGPPPIATRTNRHGGMLGGISSGMPIVLTASIGMAVSRTFNT